jgi:ABC-type glycerol-3-phosphate transport system substrate-binding protein
MPGALTPYQYEGGTYALPETQSFDMLFYRTDVFEELGLTPPKTWAEFYYVLSVLQRNNLLTGIPESQRMFEALLYQKGASLYSANLSSTAFDEPEALAAFEQWTGLYAKYSLPLVFDFFNRFRSGEMPMAIVPYTQCNYLAGAAPEIKGLWDFAPVPGTVYADGTVSNAETATGTGCVMVAKDDTIQYQNVFDFLSWWVSADAQAQFGLELENLMGAAARYPTANVEAFERLPWEPRQTDALTEQWKQVVEAPQIPGGYYVGRNISFAFRSVIYGNANERETLYKYNKEINKEITRKRIEFDLY